MTYDLELILAYEPDLHSVKLGHQAKYQGQRGWRGPAVEHWSLADVLSLSCARLVADG